MGGLLGLLVVASWIAVVPGGVTAKSDAAVREAASARELDSWRPVTPVAMRKGWQAASIVDDPVSDGIGRGAAIGAGAGVGLVALAYATCGDGCEAPAAAPMFLLGGGVGAGTGALIGWLVDSLHTSRPQAARAVSVAPVFAPRYKAVAVGVRF